jgi:oligoendopeptidase F
MPKEGGESTMPIKSTGAESVRWNLADLYGTEADLTRDLASAAEKASSFSTDYRSRVAELSPGRLAEALERFESIHDSLGRAYTYAYLQWVTATEDPDRGALLQRVREEYTRIAQELIFFELEWARAPAEAADALLGASEVARYRHYLELARLREAHMLSEPEERIVSEMDVTGRAAWNRYFDETIASIRFELDGESVTEQEVLSKLHESDRSLRERAAHSFTDGLRQHIRTLTFVSNTLLSDKSTTDRLRGYDGWLSSRNQSNEVDDATVEALISSVTDRYDLVARFYELKKRLLGLDELVDYDRYAPIGEADTRYIWSEAREVVVESYNSFLPRFGEIANRFFDDRWIDAAVVKGKRAGAFSHGAVPSAHPYILMNFTGRIRDVQTLAHELGHGIHQYLSSSQGLLHADTPLTTAETASVFGEMLVFQRLMESEASASNRLAMLVGKIDDTIATVFRQIAMNRFEEAVHDERRSAGELSTDRFCELWLETQRAMFRGSVTLGDHYRYWWSYIPHFHHTPGYVYAYAFGELLVLALHELYLQEGAPFARAYEGLLEAGGSDWPHLLVGRLGVDLKDHTFWQRGLSSIQRLIEEAEQLAGRVQ